MRHPTTQAGPLAAAPRAPLATEEPSPALVIVNTTAGQGCPPGWAGAIEDGFRRYGVPTRIVLARTGADILAAAARAVEDGTCLVVAAGGDGTVSAVASRLAGTRVALGVLPTGTLNHFARDLGLPRGTGAAIEAIARGHEAAVDVGEVNGRLFINNSSLGLYPDIVLDRERQRRRLGRGRWRALLAACVHAARRYPVLSLRIDLGTGSHERRSAFVFIGNNRYSMEGFTIGERESLARGELSLYVTQRTGRFGLLRLALRALLHRLRQARDFDMVTARALVVRTPQRTVRVAVDGEVTRMETPLRYSVRPGALRVRVPARATPTGAPA
jgi:diacylglycerol kinase family enzyme